MFLKINRFFFKIYKILFYVFYVIKIDCLNKTVFEKIKNRDR